MPEAGAEPLLEVLRPGLLSSLQDLGRFGYQALGIAESGAMDTWSLVLANRLLGNPDGACALEVTLVGPRLRVLAPTCLALAGADLGAELDGRPLAPGRSFAARPGQVLSFAGRRRGLRAYLAVPGGFAVPPVLGSRSTYLYAGFGGLEGRALRKGDVLPCPAGAQAPAPRQAPPELCQLPEPPHELRVIMGPHLERFTEQGVHTFLNATYRISPQSNRMGYRLEGPALEHSRGPIVVSEATPPGAVQVPGRGRPVILLRERGTTGGYTKIATVITCDLDRLAQLGDGEEVRFRAVELDTAHRLERRRWQEMDRWQPAAKG